MSAVIRHTGDPYPVERAITRVLAGRGWRVVVMHAEDGGAIRIAPEGWDLFGAGVLVLHAGEQLEISGTGGLKVGSVPAVTS